jgi:sulfur carrier protein
MHNIVLNGQPLQTDTPTLQTLLEQQGFNFQTSFACAINQAFIARPKWPEQIIQAGDVIDVVTPVTGG